MGNTETGTAFFERVIDEAHLPASSIAYVGDRLDNDIMPAIEAGMAGIFLCRGPWGSVHSNRSDAARAHAQINDLSELPDAILRLA
jgi:FMN phosphatase YigB (HAD superfamily)